MSSADEIVELTFSEYLERGGYRRTWDTLQTAVNDAILSWDLIGRVQDVPNDAIVECEYELALNYLTNKTTDVLTLQERGYAESTAAAHDAGKKVYVNPRYTRVSVLKALKATIRDLYNWGAYRRVISSSLVIPSIGLVELPAAAIDVLDVLVETHPAAGLSADWMPLQRGRHYEVLPQFEPARLRIAAGLPGRTMQLVYKANYDFTGWSAVGATNLTTLGVSEYLQEHLPMAVAGYVLRGSEVPKLQEQELKRLLIGQSETQIGANIQVGQLLIDTFRANYVKNEIIRLQELDKPGVAYAGS